MGWCFHMSEGMVDDVRRFYTPSDLVKMGYGSRATVYRDIEDGSVPSMKVGKGRVLIPRERFEEYLALREVACRKPLPKRDEADAVAEIVRRIEVLQTTMSDASRKKLVDAIAGR